MNASASRRTTAAATSVTPRASVVTVGRMVYTTAVRRLHGVVDDKNRGTRQTEGAITVVDDVSSALRLYGTRGGIEKRRKRRRRRIT